MPFYDRDDFGHDTSLGYLARRVVQASLVGLEPVFASEGISYLHWSALVSLWFGRAPTCNALARDLGHDAGATTRLIDTLEAKGLVARERSASDRRVVNLTLTPAGQALAQTCRMGVTDQWNVWLKGWDDADVTRLIGYLQRLRDDIEAANAEAPCAD